MVIVYAINLPSAFKSVDNHIANVRALCRPDVQIILVGNKCDLDNDRRVKYEELEDKADEHSIKFFFETSALSEYRGTINGMFTAIINQMATLPLDASRRNIKLSK